LPFRHPCRRTSGQRAGLDVDTTNSAAALCRETALFLGKPLVRLAVDARETRRPVSALLVVAVDREVER
jgi:hypothetical protein